MAENEYTKAWDARDRDRENRIEALRAASRVVGKDAYRPGQLTLELAKQFEKYLEAE